MGTLNKQLFDKVYDEVIIGNHFFEKPEYYHFHRKRYLRTMEHLVKLPLNQASTVLDVGGGQFALLCNKLMGCTGVLADVNEKYSDAVTKYGLKFVSCDLVHDDIPDREIFDLVVLGEVIEHIPIPPHIVLEKVKTWIKPGGYLFLTTPNLFRIRNVVRLFMGKPLFCPFFYPARGVPIGHLLEYSEKNLRWQIDKAGFTTKYIVQQQLVNVGASLMAKIGRTLIAPLQLRPLWRDQLVALAQKPA